MRLWRLGQGCAAAAEIVLLGCAQEWDILDAVDVGAEAAVLRELDQLAQELDPMANLGVVGRALVLTKLDGLVGVVGHGVDAVVAVAVEGVEHLVLGGGAENPCLVAAKACAPPCVHASA